MKYIGFVLEHDAIPESLSFHQGKSGLALSLAERSELIRYLEGGTLVFGWMGFWEDLDTGKSISTHAYFTDGNWIWPSYYPYYLKKHKGFWVDEEFRQYVASHRTAHDKIDSERLVEIEEELITKLKAKRIP